MTVLRELEQEVQGVAEHAGPAVVGIGRRRRPGSGIVIAPGQVLTSAHHLWREEVTVRFSDEREESGSVAGADLDTNLAVVTVETGDIEPINWDTDVEEVRPGSAVLGLANPGGRGLRVSLGFVTATGRSFRGPRGRRITDTVEHSAPLVRGSAGGPLLDADGRLVGVNAVRLEGGLILALAANQALRDRVAALASGEHTERPRLGVAVAPPRIARRMRRAVGLPEREGLLVRAVEDDSPAAAAGIGRGDLIVAVSGEPVTGIEDLYRALESLAGAKLELGVLRGTEERTVAVSFNGSVQAERV